MRRFVLQVAVGALGLFMTLVAAFAAADAASIDTGEVVCAAGGGGCTDVRHPNGFVGVPVFLAGSGATALAVRRLGGSVRAIRV